MWEKIKSWFGWRKKNGVEQLLDGLKDLFRKIDDLKLAKDLNQTMLDKNDIEEGQWGTYMKDVDLNNEKVKVRPAGEYSEDYIPPYYKVSYYDLINLEEKLGSEKFFEIWHSFSDSSIPELNLEKDGKQIKFRLISIPRNNRLDGDSEYDVGMKKFKEVVLDKTE